LVIPQQQPRIITPPPRPQMPIAQPPRPLILLPPPPPVPVPAPQLQVAIIPQRRIAPQRINVNIPIRQQPCC